MAGPALAEQYSPKPSAKLLFTAMIPAVRAALDMGASLDDTRATMTYALWHEADRRYGHLKTVAVALGRTSRSVRSLAARFASKDAYERRGENLVRRVEALLTKQPLTIDELRTRMPQYYAFDSADVALTALRQAGRIQEIPCRDGRPKFSVVSPRPARAGSMTDIEECGALMHALAGVALSVDSPDLDFDTLRGQLTPAQAKRLADDLSVFIAERATQMSQAAKGDPTARHYTVYAGHTEQRAS